jgi:periplasmic protein CpxP/Spy
MSTTSRNRNLIFIIAALLLTNIAVLVYFLWIKQPDAHRDGQKKPPKEGFFTVALRDSVGFNEQQIAQYKELKDKQKKAIGVMFEEMRKAKDSLFRLIGNTQVNDSVIRKAAEAVGDRQRLLDLQSFNHFREIRALCTTPEQEQKYDTAVLRMLRKMGKTPANHNNGKKDDKKKPA